MNKKLLHDLALSAGGSHFPVVFESHQEAYTLLVLQECYKVFQKRKQSETEYLGMDYLYDIMKHFDIDPEDIVLK